MAKPQKCSPARRMRMVRDRWTPRGILQRTLFIKAWALLPLGFRSSQAFVFEQDSLHQLKQAWCGMFAD